MPDLRLKDGEDSSHSLWSFLTMLSEIDDAYERARLVATGLPSFIPGRVTGVAILDEEETCWRLALQQDGQLLTPQRVKLVQAELERVFEDSFSKPGSLTWSSRGESERALTECLQQLGLEFAVVFPLRTVHHRLGALLIGSTHVGGLSREHATLASVVADHTAIGLENLRLNARLRQHSERLQMQNELILSSAGEGIYGLDGEGYTTFVNPAALRMLGWSAAEVMGKRAHDVHHHTTAAGDPYPRIECPIYATFKDGKVHSADDEVFWRKDGTPFPVEYTSTPIRENGQLVGAVVVFRDVTARKETEARLRDARARVEELKDRLEAENTYLQEEIKSQHNFEDILGQSVAVQRVFHAIATVADTDANVIIFGETGTGKELVARAVHARSDRSGKPLIKVNCASIPRELFESEFFGHVRGAFTGAVKDRQGRFQLSDGGTLFLDEVGEIPLELQGKLLRVLQEGEFERIGEDRTRKVNVRVIAATNRDLTSEVEQGRFRQDLYYRLNVYPIEVPPLRHRLDDIPLIAATVLDRAARQFNRPGLKLSQANAKDLQAYDWPGNVRELQNVIERAVIAASAGTIAFDLPTSNAARTTASHAKRTELEADIIREDELRRRERDNLLVALKRTNWRISGSGGAAALLGIHPSTLTSRMKKMGIERPS